jgi:hypothetical protein
MSTTRSKPSSLVDTRVIYCGDNLDQLKKLPDNCIDLIYIDPPFNSNRNYEVFWGETKEKRSFDDRHASTQAYIEFMRPRCEQLARVLKGTGSFGIVIRYHDIGCPTRRDVRRVGHHRRTFPSPSANSRLLSLRRRTHPKRPLIPSSEVPTLRNSRRVGQPFSW